MENIIRRTINATKVDAYVFNKETMSVSLKSFMIDGVVNDKAKALKAVKTSNPTENIIDVENVDTVSALLGMYERDFILNAQVFTERSKENRGMVTKTISVPVAYVLVMTNDKKVKTVQLIGVKTEKEARKALDGKTEKFIMIDSVKEDEKLYCMDYDKFVSMAKLMIDNFHFAPEK